MKKIWIYCFLGAILAGGTFFACSEKKELENKKGPIEKITDKAAKEIVDQIQAPINKARSAAKQGEDRLKELDEADKKQ
jgi:hypothetical protein